MPKMTKKQCQQFEKMAESILSDALGPGQPYLETALRWILPHANGCHVELTLFRDSFDSGHGYRSSWLAGRLYAPDTWRDSGGYRLPQSELPWPAGGFTYPSGKNNFHPFNIHCMIRTRAELVHHLYSMAAEGSPERERFGAVEFETV